MEGDWHFPSASFPFVKKKNKQETKSVATAMMHCSVITAPAEQNRGGGGRNFLASNRFSEGKGVVPTNVRLESEARASFGYIVRRPFGCNIPV